MVADPSLTGRPIATSHPEHGPLERALSMEHLDTPQEVPRHRGCPSSSQFSPKPASGETMPAVIVIARSVQVANVALSGSGVRTPSTDCRST